MARILYIGSVERRAQTERGLNAVLKGENSFIPVDNFQEAEAFIKGCRLDYVVFDMHLTKEGMLTTFRYYERHIPTFLHMAKLWYDVHSAEPDPASAHGRRPRWDTAYPS